MVEGIIKKKKREQQFDIQTLATRVLGPSLRKAEQRAKAKHKKDKDEAIANHIAVAMGLGETKSKSKARASITLDNNPKLDRIIDKFFKQLESARNIFREYCTTALQEGFTPQEAWDYIRRRLNSHVPARTLYSWAESDLPLEAKKKTRPRNSTKKIASLQSSESNRYPPGEQSFTPEKQVPWEETVEIYEIPLSEARPEDVDRYDEVNCRRLLREALMMIAELQGGAEQ